MFPSPSPSPSPSPPRPGSPTPDTRGVAWTTEEHIRLLDAIEHYGYGNWQDISKKLETRTAAEIKAEYEKYFVRGIIGQLTWNNCPERERAGLPIDTTTVEAGPLSPSPNQLLATLEINDEEAVSLGYMPKMDEYVEEYDNEAEELVSNLTFSPDDEDVDISLKLALTDIYSRRVRERHRRKRIVRDYKLLSTYLQKDKNVETTRTFPEYEKEMTDILRPFAQFHTSEEHEQLIQNLIKEKEIIFRIQELFQYRKAGITSVDECVEYERFKKMASSVQPGDPTSKLGGIADEGPRSSQLAQDGTTKDQIQGPQFPMMRHFSWPTEKKAEKKKTVVRSLSFSDDDNSSSVELQFGPLTSRPNLETGQGSSRQPIEESVDTVGRSIANTMMRNAHLLNEKELDLCQQTNLKPEQYLTVKTALLLEGEQVLNIPHSNDSPLTLSEWEKIKTYMVSNGWLDNIQTKVQQ